MIPTATPRTPAHYRSGALILRLRLPFGTVRVDLGRASIDAGRVGQNVEVLASKRQDEQGQRFMARELRFADAPQILRDTQGVPL